MESKKLKKLFTEHRFVQYANATELFAVKEIIKQKACKVILYGGGNAATIAVRYLKKMSNIKIDIIVDRNPVVNELDGIKVVDRETFSEYRKDSVEEFCALVAVFAYDQNDDVKSEINTYLLGEGCIKIVDFCPQLGGMTKVDWYDFFIKNQEDFCRNISLFADDISKKTFYEYIKSYLEGRAYEGNTFPEKDKYFVINESSEEIVALNQERWINFGSYTGDTIYNYLGKGMSFEKIYAVEGDFGTAKKLENNLMFLPTDIREKIEVVNYFFGQEEGQKEIDEYFENEQITYINMDIEGSEVQVLTSGKELIKRCRPVLAICVYHKKDDLLTIPRLIESMVREYVFYLRKYPSLVGDYYDGRYCINELVLYAVPKERIRKRK